MLGVGLELREVPVSNPDASQRSGATVANRARGFARKLVETTVGNIALELCVPRGCVVLSEPLSESLQVTLGQPPDGARDFSNGGHAKNLLRLTHRNKPLDGRSATEQSNGVEGRGQGHQHREGKEVAPTRRRTQLTGTHDQGCGAQ